MKETENFPNPGKETDIQVPEAQRVPNKMNSKTSTSRDIVITMSKIKERVLKAAREKQFVKYKGIPKTSSADISGEPLQARREWQDRLQVLKGKNFQPRIFYLLQLPFTIGGEFSR